MFHTLDDYKDKNRDEKAEKDKRKTTDSYTGGNNGDELVFEDDSDDDEDLGKEDEKNTSGDKNMKYQIVKEKYDAQGNKIYSKEIATNKLPKEYK